MAFLLGLLFQNRRCVLKCCERGICFFLPFPTAKLHFTLQVELQEKRAGAVMQSTKSAPIGVSFPCSRSKHLQFERKYLLHKSFKSPLRFACSVRFAAKRYLV